MKIIIIGTILFVPNRIIRIGSHPNAGIGMSMAKTGLKMVSIREDAPMIIPTVMPQNDPKKNPIKTLARVLRKFVVSTPDSMSSQQLLATSIGDGTKLLVLKS